MLLDLSRIRGGIEHVERRFEPSTLAVRDDGFAIKAPVHLVADIQKDGRKVRLTGRVTTTLDCECSRCLDPFDVPVDAKLDLLFLPAGEEVAAGGDDDEEAAVQDDDLGVSYYKEDTIDLGEVVREQLFLALPMKPLCQDACKGLCPMCGANRNRETCSCQTEWTDPRLDALKALRTEER